MFELQTLTQSLNIAQKIGFGVEEGTYTPPTLSSTSSWSPYFKDFLSKCLTIDPRDRWTAEALLRHSFITGSPNAKYDPYDASESVFVVADLVKRSLAHETTIEDMHKTSSIDNLVDFRPVPGNRVGGLSTVTERVPGTAETGCLLESNGDDTSIDEGRSRTISTGSRASFARHRSDNSDGNNSVGEHPEGWYQSCALHRSFIIGTLYVLFDLRLKFSFIKILCFYDIP